MSTSEAHASEPGELTTHVSKRSLLDLRIRARINSGFGLLLIAMSILAGVAYLQIGRLGDRFHTYGDMASDALLVAELESALTEMQLNAREFMATSSDKDLQEFKGAEQQVRRLLDEAKTEIHKPERAELVKKIDQELKAYSEGFAQIATLLARRHELVEKSLNPTGQRIREALSQIRDGAFKAGDFESASHAGIAQEDLLLARLYAAKFLDANDPKAVDRVLQEIAELNRALDALDSSLEHPDRRALLAQIRVDVPAYTKAVEAVAQAVNERNRIREEVLDHDAELMIANAEKIMASAKRDEDRLELETVGIISEAEIETAAIGTASLALGLLLAWLIGRSIASPVVSLTAAMRQLAAGDNSVVVPALGRRDEVGEMAQTVEVFKENALRIVQMKADEQERERRAVEQKRSELMRIADDFEQTFKAVVTDVSSSADQMQATAETMSRNASQTGEQSTAVAAASQQATANVQTVASAAEELSASVAEISRQVSQSTTIARQAVEQANQTNSAVQGLADAAQRIGEVVKLISAIAAQTNLLALNATIEAARAGDAGKGFAVVASEVKTLATETARATEEISAQVAAIQQESLSSVSAIRSIGSVISQMSEIATAIASAVEEQSSATQEISRNAQQAAEGTEEVSSTIVSVNQAANDTGRGADEVLQSAENLGRQSGKLNTEVERFLNRIRAA